MIDQGQVYKTAFLALQERVKNGLKTTYGKNELLTLMADIFIATFNALDEEEFNEGT